jgi:membrane protein implicated in regulation of membrane protease activity
MTILVLSLIALDQWITLPSWLFWGLISAWVGKDMLVFPFVWRAYDRPFPGDPRHLIGTEGIAEERLAPSGHVRVHGEIWQAEVKGPVPAIEKGEKVSIRGMNGLVLLVEPGDKKQ